MSSEIVAAFSPNDFFYVKAQQNKTMPDSQKCDELFNNMPLNCDAGPTQVCVDAQLCLNKKNANTLYNIQNKNGGSDQRYSDVKTVYNDALFNSFNLGVGIVVTIGFIYTKYIYTKPTP
jgi:hypothetical protein